MSSFQAWFGVQVLTHAQGYADTCAMSEQPVTPEIPEFDLADRLRKALRHADVSVQSMAEYLEVSRNTIGNWINGHTRPRPAEMKLWALRCGVPYEWLIGGDDVANRSTIRRIMVDQSALPRDEILAHAKSIDALRAGLHRRAVRTAR